MPTSIAALILAAAPLGADDPPKAAASTPPPAGATAFRLLVRQYEAARQPVGRGEVVASRGRVYFLESGSNELVVLEPAARAVHLYHIKLDVAADLTYADLDAAVAAIRRAQGQIIAAHARGKSRAERIDADMRRDQVEPRFEPRFDEATRTLTMANPTVQIEARGEPDDDPARLATIAGAAVALAKLRAAREPDDLRHLVQLEAITALVAGRKLRPAEFTYLLRRAGPPEKYRQTFELVPAVGAEDREGLDLLDARLARARRIPFERYLRRIDPDDPK